MRAVDGAAATATNGLGGGTMLWGDCVSAPGGDLRMAIGERLTAYGLGLTLERSCDGEMETEIKLGRGGE